MKALLLATAAVIAMPALATAQTMATDPAPGDDAAAQSEFPQSEPTAEIIVTAQRREERLQDVPVAISVYDDTRRDLVGIATIQDVAKFTPGVSFSEFPNRLFVRGVGRFTNQLGSEPGVATYVDGFYTSETAAIGSSPILIDRIEILRGPQGTLYGRNSIGGAANVVSQRPTSELAGEVRMLAADYGLIAGAGAISGPLTDWLRFRVTGSALNQRDGYLDNDAGGDNYRSRSQLLEAQMEADIGSRGNLWVKYQFFNSEGRPTINTQIDPYDTTTYFSGSSLVPNPTFGAVAVNPAADDIFRASLNEEGFQRIRNAHQLVANGSWDFGGVIARYIGGYQAYDFSRSIDYDRSSLSGYDFFGRRISSNLIEDIIDEKRWHSHELNLTSDTGGPFSYIAGIYYYSERQRQDFTLRSPDQAQLANVLTPNFTLTPAFVPVFVPGAPNPDRSFTALTSRLEAESYAAYGQVDYKVTPTLTLTGGLRYTRDEKQGSEGRRFTFFVPFGGAGLAQTFYGAVPSIPPSFLPVLGAAIDAAFATSAFDGTPALSQRDLSNSWEALTGKAGIAYDPDGATNLYASYSRGYKAGGYNLYNFTDPVDKEQVDAFEIGLKKTLPGRIQANLAAFYYDYRNLQIPVSFIDIVLQQNFVNAPRAQSYGAEAEITWSPTDSLQLLVSYSYLDATLREFSGFIDVADPAAGNQDLRGNRLPQSPRHKATANILNTFDLGGGASLTPVATVNYTGEQYFAPFTTDKYKQDGYVRADFRLVLRTADGLQINGYLNNAFNDRSFNGFQLGPEASGFARQVTFNLPRTYGIEVIGKF